MDDFLNHTHPPLWATSLLREVNLGTACGCEVFCSTRIPRSSRGMTADLFFYGSPRRINSPRDDDSDDLL